jgi:hypothetical protein
MITNSRTITDSHVQPHCRKVLQNIVEKMKKKENVKT